MTGLHRIVSLWPSLLLLALLAPGSFAQAPADGAFLPDGIEATGDSAEVRALHEWANEHRRRHPEQAQLAAERALALARELGDQQGVGQSLQTLGYLAVDSDPDQAESYYKKAWAIFERTGTERDVLKTRLGLGHVYLAQGSPEQALAAYFTALEGFERLGDTRGQAAALGNIGIVYKQQGNLAEARSYYEQSVELAEAMDNHMMVAINLSNLAGLLIEQGSFEAAEGHLRRALAIYEEEEAQSHIAIVMGNLGHVLNRQGRHEGALPYLEAAERMEKEQGAKGTLMYVYGEFAKAYLGLEDIVRALHYANEALLHARVSGSISQQMAAHETLAQIYKANGNDGQALAHYEHYLAARDSVFNAERTEIISEMQARYESEKKQRAIERLEQQSEIQALRASRRQTVLLAGIVVVLLALALFYYRYRVKRKAGRLLEELDAAKTRFFANISHEFRTPLTVILGGVQDALAGRFGKTTGKLSEQLYAMLRNTRQLQRLIDEVLELNRLEAGKLELDPAPGDLVQTLRRLVEADAPLAERNGIDLRFEPAVAHCPRLHDRAKLEKIVGNLLSNALKFTPEGGTVRVELRCDDPIEIAVSDTGPGIPAEIQDKVFDRFAQVGDGARHGGTGIGLALAKELAELHGGTIALESKPGKGSVFTARLPLEAIALDDVVEAFAIGGDGADLAGQALATPSEGETAPDESGVSRPTATEPDRTTVLIIEDNDDVRAYIRRSLETTYRVLEAETGEMGLQRARSALPDLIVSDVMLPGIDGYEVARRLKTESGTECIPVVMLTARAAEEDQTEGYGSGAEVYITKPFSPDTLRAAVARLLEERRRLQRRLQEDPDRKGKEAPENGHPTFLDRARAVVLENLPDEDFSVDGLASALGMSLRTLQRRLKPETGLAPGDFVRTLRLEQARKLLTNGAGSVSEVAYAVGFRSLSHFTNCFREHYGEAPSNVLNAGAHPPAQPTSTRPAPRA